MAENQSTAKLEIKVGGQPLRDIDYAEARIESSRNLPDVCSLIFGDPDFDVVKRGGFAVGKTLEVVATTNEASGKIFSGEITGLILTKTEEGARFTEVRSKDLGHRLMQGTVSMVYEGISIKEIVGKVLGRLGSGVTEGTIEEPPGLGPQEKETISQVNETDWEFLTRLADWAGAQFNVGMDGKLDFIVPKSPTGGATTNSAANPLVLDLQGPKVRSLRAVVTASEQVPEVEVRYWDPATQKPVSAAEKPKAENAKLAGADPNAPDKLADAVKAKKITFVSAAATSQQGAQTMAAAQAARIAESSRELQGVSKPDPRLLPGTDVSLVNAGDTFNGRYTVSSVAHVFSQDHHDRTEFRITGRRDRSLGALLSGSDRGGRGRIYGLVPGVVDDTQDTTNAGRVRVLLPWLADGFKTGWARVVQMGAGAGRGMLCLPEKGDEVLVGFEHGSVDRPYVLGGLFHAGDGLPKTDGDLVDAAGQVSARSWRSRSGHELTFIEGSTTSAVRLATADDDLSVVLDKQGTTLTVDSKGTVTITGKQGITIDAASGALELKGTNISVKATSSVEIEGMQFSANGSTMSELKGGQVFIN